MPTIFKVLTFLTPLISITSNIALSCTDLKVTTSGSINLSDSAIPRSLTITAEKNGPPCDFFITISAGNAGNYERKLVSGSHNISYNIFRDANASQVIKDIPEANQSEVLEGKFLATGAESKTFTVTAKTSVPQYKPTGIYNDTVNIKIYKGAYSSSAAVENTLSGIHLVYNQPVIQALSIVDSGSAFQPGDTKQFISFMPLKEGATQNFDLLIRSNSSYTIRVESQNDGRLKHDKQERFVKYSLELNGRPLTLDSKTQALGKLGSNYNFEQGDRYPLSVKIGATKGALAGKYSDYITFTVEAN